jgi:hypothetical protein
MTDYSANGSVPPLIPGESYVQTSEVVGSLVLRGTYDYVSGQNSLTAGTAEVPVMSVGPAYKVGFWTQSSNPTTQPSAGSLIASFASNGGVIGSASGASVGTLTTFNGYTVGDIVVALQREGLLK